MTNIINQEIIKAHDEIKDDENHTVGYGERFEEYTGPGLIIHDNNNALGISHENEGYKHGFDFTTLSEHGQSGVDNFLTILQTAGLDPFDDYVRVFRDMGRGVDTSYPDRWIYVWVNDEIMVATTNNPITGESHSKNHLGGGQGYTGMIGICGEENKARKTANKILDIADAIKGHEQGRIFV